MKNSMTPERITEIRNLINEAYHADQQEGQAGWSNSQLMSSYFDFPTPRRDAVIAELGAEYDSFCARENAMQQHDEY